MDQLTPDLRFDSRFSDEDRSPLRALHSLTDGQIAKLTAGLSCLSSCWSFERHESCDGHLRLMLMHPTRDTTVVVERDPSGIAVGLMLGDALQPGVRHASAVAGAIELVKAIVGEVRSDDTRHTA